MGETVVWCYADQENLTVIFEPFPAEEQCLEVERRMAVALAEAGWPGEFVGQRAAGWRSYNCKPPRPIWERAQVLAFRSMGWREGGGHADPG